MAFLLFVCLPTFYKARSIPRRTRSFEKRSCVRKSYDYQYLVCEVLGGVKTGQGKVSKKKTVGEGGVLSEICTVSQDHQRKESGNLCKKRRAATLC
jgi:hypothetical protein